MHESHSAQETEAIAEGLALRLQPGDVIALDGDLGAGKTQFVRGLARGLGIDPRQVSSPTYVLLQLYEGGRLPLFHLDAYRIVGPADLEAIGFSELLEQGGIVVIEWASRVADLLPARHFRVTLTQDPIHPDHRTIGINPP